MDHTGPSPLWRYCGNANESRRSFCHAWSEARFPWKQNSTCIFVENISRTCRSLLRLPWFVSQHIFQCAIKARDWWTGVCSIVIPFHTNHHRIIHLVCALLFKFAIFIDEPVFFLSSRETDAVNIVSWSCGGQSMVHRLLIVCRSINCCLSWRMSWDYGSLIRSHSLLECCKDQYAGSLSAGDEEMLVETRRSECLSFDMSVKS